MASRFSIGVSAWTLWMALNTNVIARSSMWPGNGTCTTVYCHSNGGKRVNDTTRTYVVANFKETQIDGMRPGNRAEVHLDAYPGRTFEGEALLERRPLALSLRSRCSWSLSATNYAEITRCEAGTRPNTIDSSIRSKRWSMASRT